MLETLKDNSIHVTYPERKFTVMWPLAAATKSLEKHAGSTPNRVCYIYIKSFLLLCSCAYSFPTYNVPSVSPYSKLSFLFLNGQLYISSLLLGTPWNFQSLFSSLSLNMFFTYRHIKHYAFKNRSIFCLKSHAFVIFLMKYLVLDSKTASSIKYLLQKSVFF